MPVMQTSNRVLAGICAAMLALPAGAAVAQYVGPGEVETAEFGQSTFDIGSLTPSTGALPEDLWEGTRAEDVAFLLANLPRSFDHPAELDLLRRTLLSPGPGPDNADTALTAQKVLTLAEAGFYEEAASLAELSGGLSTQPALSRAVAYADLLRGDIALACRRGSNLQEGRGEPFWLKLRMICYHANGETAAADLTLGLLREQGSLAGNEAELFTAMATGSTPGTFEAPVTGFGYVAARELGADFAPQQLEGASGVILRAVANDPEASLETRAYAIHEALYMGIIRPSQARSLVARLGLSPEQVGTAREALESRPSDPLTSLLVYQAASEMTAPEFTIDRSALIGDALQSARSGKDFTVLAHLFAPLARDIEVVINYSPYAVDFALAGIVAGDAELTRKWIGALTADQTNPDGIEDAAGLLGLMSLKDPKAATAIGSSYGIDIPAVEQEWTLATPLDRELVPPFVGIGLNTARSGAQGQAALSWLILSHIGVGDGVLEDIRNVILADAEDVLTEVDIAGQLAFEAALDEAVSHYTEGRPAGDDSAADGTSAATGPAAGIQPRVKPGTDD